LAEPEQMFLFPESVMTNVILLKSYDLYKLTPRQIGFRSNFELMASRSGLVHGFGLFFSAEFSHCYSLRKKEVGFCNFPAHTATSADLGKFPSAASWKGTVCYIDAVVSGITSDSSRILGVFKMSFDDSDDLSDMKLDITFETRDTGETEVRESRKYSLF
jgi:hypothetical protein